MSKLKQLLISDDTVSGYLYFYIHMVTEIASFYVLSTIIGDFPFIWFFLLCYDALAFVPQSLIGYLSDKLLKINLGLIGTFLLVISIIFFNFNINDFIPLILLCLGNCCMHVNGAEVTLRSSNGNLSASAIFVAGGSFGVIAGKLLSSISLPYYFIIILLLTMIPFIILAEDYKFTKKDSLTKFNYHNPKIKSGVIVIIAVLIVMVRGYMGYGIPTSWNKTIIETIMLYVTMGVGKALGGICSDLFGMKKTAIISSTLALPFLLFGDKYMMISLIGVMLFSMTMSITLGLLVSVLKNSPGLAFGLTTIGLFLGTLPIFFIKFNTLLSNCIVIILLTIVCLIGMVLIIRKDGDVT